MTGWRRALLVFGLFATGASTDAPRADPGRLARWTTGLRDARLAPLVERQLQRSRMTLGLDEALLPNAASFARWYRCTNGKSLADGVDPEEAGPLVDGRWQTNRIGAAVSRARDAHLLRQIAKRLGADGSVMVVFGGSHAAVQRPALDAMLGRPCYVGTDLRAASATCMAASARKDEN